MRYLDKEDLKVIAFGTCLLGAVFAFAVGCVWIGSGFEARRFNALEGTSYTTGDFFFTGEYIKGKHKLRYIEAVIKE